MGVNSRDDVSTYVYHDDAANTYSVHLTKQVADAGGFVALGGTPPANFKGPWPGNHRRLRHIGVKRTLNGKVLRNRIPIAQGSTNDHYKLVNLQVELDDVNWTVTGRIGEKVRV